MLNALLDSSRVLVLKTNVKYVFIFTIPNGSFKYIEAALKLIEQVNRTVKDKELDDFGKIKSCVTNLRNIVSGNRKEMNKMFTYICSNRHTK